MTDDRRPNQIRGFRRARGICRVARSARRDEERPAAFHAGGIGDRCPRPPPAGVRRDLTRLAGLCAAPWPGGPSFGPTALRVDVRGRREDSQAPTERYGNGSRPQFHSAPRALANEDDGARDLADTAQPAERRPAHAQDDSPVDVNASLQRRCRLDSGAVSARDRSTAPEGGQQAQERGVVSGLSRAERRAGQNAAASPTIRTRAGNNIDGSVSRPAARSLPGQMEESR